VSTINLFRNSFEDIYETIHVEDGKPINETINADFTNAVIGVNGFLQDENYILQEGDLCTIRLFPEGDAKDWFAGAGIGGSIALGVMGIISLAAGPIGWAALGIGLAIGVGVGALGTGIASAAGYSLVGWLGDLGKQPDLKSPESIKGIPQLRGAKNQSNYNKPIPIVLGKHLYTPMYIGMPYTEIDGEDGEDQYFNALFLLGYSRLQVTDIKLGILGDLCSNRGTNARDDDFLIFDGNSDYTDSNPKLELRQGASSYRPDGEMELYPQKVFEEQLSIELSRVAVDDNRDNDVVTKANRFTARDPMKVQIEFTFSGGLIKYDNEGNKQSADVSILIQWKKPQEDDNSWKPFTKIGKKPDGTFESNIAYDNGKSTITRTKSKVMRFIAEKEFNYSDVIDAADRTIELRIERISLQDPDNTRISDKVYLTAIRTWCFDYDKSKEVLQFVPLAPMIEKYRNKTCRLGFRIKATGALQGTIDALNCMVQSYGRTWDGTNWSVEESPTQNPASIALKILQSPSLGSKAYPISMLDERSFREFYDWCNLKGFTCNGVLTSKKRLDDVLAAVLGTGRAMRIINGNRYGVLIDKPRDIPVTILNSQNVLEATNQKAFADLPDGLCIKFINEGDGFQQTEIYVMKDGSDKPWDNAVIETIDMSFITDYQQIVKNARYQLACRYLRPEIWNRKIGRIGYLLAMGDRVEIQDDTILVGIGEGAEITALVYDNSGNIMGIKTDGLFDVTDTTQQYGVMIAQYDGINAPAMRTKEVVISGVNVYSDFTFAAPIQPSETVKPSVGDNVSFGVYDKITTSAICFGKKDNGDGTFDVTLVPYQEGVYTADSGTIPEFDSKVTAPQGLAAPQVPPPDTVTRNEAIEISQTLGTPGPPATMYEIIPSATVIRYYNTGVIEPSVISCIQQSTTGDGVPVESNKTLKYLTSTSDETLYEGEITVGEWDWIEFRLYEGDKLLDREDVPVLKDGAPAVSYELLPSVWAVKCYNTGVIDPPTVSCIQRSKTGGELPVPSDKNLRYATSLDEEQDYIGEITIDPRWDRIVFSLYDGDPNDGGTILDQEDVIILSDGPPATVYELLPSVPMIIRDTSGAATPAAISCSQQVIVGSNPPILSEKTIKYITSETSIETDYSDEIPVAFDWIEFRLYDGNILLDTERIFVLTEGNPSTVYELQPSVSAIRIYDGIAIPRYISCQQVSITGNALPVFSNKTLVYATSLDDEQPYTGPFIINPLCEWVEFRLYDGDTILDRETVPVLKDGVSPIHIDLDNQNIPVRYDEYGEPYLMPVTTQATLYNGNAPITYATFLVNLPTKEPVFYPGSDTIFDPALGDFFPIDAVQWRIIDDGEGILYYPSDNDIFDPMMGDFYPERIIKRAPFATIDQTGFITVHDVPEDMVKIIVGARYDGTEYSAVLTVTRVKDPETPVTVDIENENTSIACDVYGEPHPGQLPFATKAILYRGTELVDPFWFLSKSKRGISIDQDGIITVDQDADIANVNNILVNAAYKGKTYTRMFTLTKTRDGNPATVYELLPDVNVIKRDSTGANTPAAVGCSQQIIVGNDQPETSAKTIKYVTSASSNEVVYSAPVTVGTLDWIEFRLYAESKLLDKEHIPVLKDGSEGLLDIENDNTSIACNVYGEPYPESLPITTKAVLYLGHNEVNPVWSLTAPSGISINQNGIITVQENSVLDIVNNITVEAKYNGDTYFRTMTIVKTRDGEDAIRLDVAPNVTFINCDDSGFPIDGLPFTAKALLYKGPLEDITRSPVTYSLPNAPDGVKIDQDGNILVAPNPAALADSTVITVNASFEGVIYSQTFAIEKKSAGKDTIWVESYPSAIGVQCDYLGNPLKGLPAIVPARLFKGTMEVDTAMELERAARVEILHYPGNIFDPMLGDFCPTQGYPVTWSLIGAPPGVSIDRHGLISVSLTAQLADINNITVQAIYHGEAYTGIFSIDKNLGGAPARGILSIVAWYYSSDSSTALTGGYWTTAVPGKVRGKFIWQKTITLYTDGTTSETIPVCLSGQDGDAAIFPIYRGVTTVADTSNTGIITFTSGGQGVMNNLDRVLFMGSTIDDWVRYRVMRWHEEGYWEAITPESNQVEYMEALRDMTEGAPDGVFSNVFCRVLFAQQAAIATLQSQLIQIGNAIFGGERFTRSGNSVIDEDENGSMGLTGFMIGADGRLIASNAIINGTINAIFGTFNNITISGDSLFQGVINSGPLILSEDSPVSDVYDYQIGESSITIYNDAKNAMEFSEATGSSGPTFSVRGTYGDKEIIRIQFGHTVGYQTYFTRVYYQDGTNEEAALSDGPLAHGLQYALSFQYTSGGKTLKLIGIPSQAQTAGSGIVYNDRGTLKIS
jgi:hypothetical protein